MKFQRNHHNIGAYQMHTMYRTNLRYMIWCRAAKIH